MSSTLGIIFDIGAESVGAGAAFFENKKAQLLYTERQNFSAPSSDPSRLIETMLLTLKGVEEFLAKNILSNAIFRGKKISHVNYFLSSQWIESEMKTIEIEEKNPIAVSRSLVENILNKEARAFTRDLFTVIEKRIVSLKLNGYQISEPYGARAKKITLLLCLSMIPTHIMRRLEEVSRIGIFHRAQISYFSSASFLQISLASGKFRERVFRDEVAAPDPIIALETFFSVV